MDLNKLARVQDSEEPIKELNYPHITGGGGGSLPEKEEVEEIGIPGDIYDKIEESYNQIYSRRAEEEYPDDEDAEFNYGEGTADEAVGVICVSDRLLTSMEKEEIAGLVYWETPEIEFEKDGKKMYASAWLAGV